MKLWFCYQKSYTIRDTEAFAATSSSSTSPIDVHRFNSLIFCGVGIHVSLYKRHCPFLLRFLSRRWVRTGVNKLLFSAAERQVRGAEEQCPSHLALIFWNVSRAEFCVCRWVFLQTKRKDKFVWVDEAHRIHVLERPLLSNRDLMYIYLTKIRKEEKLLVYQTMLWPMPHISSYLQK